MHSVHRVIAAAVLLLLLAGAAARTMAQDLLPEPEKVFLPPSLLHLSVDTTLSFSAMPAPDRLTWHSAITNLPADWASAGGTIISPSSLPAIAGIAAATGALLLTDHLTHRPSIRLARTSPFVNDFSDAAVRVGEGSTHLGIAAAFGLYGFLASDHRALSTASQTLEALLATGITVQVLKRIAGRESPAMATRDGGRWRPFPSLRLYQRNQPKYYAFPSGHIATATATLTVIASNYPEQRWITPVGCVALAALGFGLVNVHYHWYSDLPLGIGLGYMFGKIAAGRTDPDDIAAHDAARSRIVVLPAVEEEGGGVTIALLF